MKLNDAVLGAVFCALGLWIVLYSAGLPKPRHLSYGPGLFPTLMGAGLIVCGGIQTIAGLLRWRSAPIVERPAWLGHRRLILNLAVIPAACLFYYVAADRLGFLFTGLTILVVMLVVGGVAPLRAAIVGLVMIVVVTMIFASILHVPLPWGVLAPISGQFIW
ncbi:tripartite tricarboxylate transporter TctB family protein [Cereibacter johrii]|uniref:tripartite tricarboxylate transporter TctB family protein n=1 Tax=Cereibacter johrii TaxID=445629 RepID=UPI003CEB57B0